MFGRTYYHEILRNTIVSFGTSFNDIHIVRTDAGGTTQQSMKVPLAYGPKQKFLVRLRGDANLDNTVDIIDCVYLVNNILNPDDRNYTLFDRHKLDLNTDGDINILDITTIINIILN